MMSHKDFMISGSEASTTKEQAEEDYSLLSICPSLIHDDPFMSGNLGGTEDEVPDNSQLATIQDYLINDETLDADSAFAVFRKSPAPVDMASFIPLTPTGPPKQQYVLPGWKFEASVIATVETASISYWRSKRSLFVEPYTPFSVQLSFTPLEGSAGIRDLMFRCTAVFKDPEYEHLVVRRCEKVKHNQLPVEGALGIVETVEDSAWYCGSGSPNSHYSVVVPMQASSTTARYKMVCQTSCSQPGVNRRALALDFTAEDRSGAVYGRDRILVRPCAKPRRDLKLAKKRLEEQNMKQAGLAKPKGEPLRTKRRRLSSSDEDQDTPLDC